VIERDHAPMFEAYADHAAAHSEAADKLPLVGFYIRKYTCSDGKPGYALQFDIEDWVERPPAVLHIKPPPLAILEAVPKPAAETKGAEPAQSATTESTDKPKAVGKPARKIKVPGAPSMDEEIPFAPEWRG
jgi:hypothetical protein